MNLLARARLSARLFLSPPSSAKCPFYLHHITPLQQCNFSSAKATSTIHKTPQSTKPRTHKSSEKFSSSPQEIKKHTEAATSVWPKPQAIPYQAKLANFVNLMGNVKTPVQFETDSEGKHFTATVISLGNEGERGSLLIPVVFEGDLAHVAACHVKEKDCVFVSGQLSVDPLRWLLSKSLGKFHVVAENINFVVGFEKSVSDRKMGVSFSAVEIDELDRLRDKNVEERLDSVDDDVDSNQVLGVEFDSANEIETVPQSVAVEGGNVVWNTVGGSGSKMKDANQILDLWMNLVKNPLQWWDYRGHKTNGLVKEKFPDFKQKETGEALWMSSAPRWILPGLEKLEFDVKELKGERVSGGEWHSERKQSADLDNSWKNLVENPDKWWDNRARKRNSKAPDFRHKETGEVLWLSSSPDWALSKLPPMRA